VFSFSGFRDGHSHPLFAARESEGPDISGCRTPDEIASIISGFLRSSPNVTWLDCSAYTHEIQVPDGVRYFLDSVSSTVPIVVHADDHHSIWVNSAALERAGYGVVAPALERGLFEIDAHGVPTGIIHEWEAMSLIYAHQPAPTLESDLQALDRAQRRLLASGVVAVQDAWIDRGMELPYLAAAERDLLRVRVNLAVRIDPKNWHADLEFAKSVRSSARATENALLTADTVKIFIDGVFGSETALVLEPYCSGSHGQALWTPAELQKMAQAADSAGFQLHFHAVGDAAVLEALRAVDQVTEGNGPTDRRPVIAHADLVPEAAYGELVRLGLTACVQPAWATEGPGVNQAREVLGQTRGNQMYPLRKLLTAGVRLSFGSDWPVTDPEPWLGLLGAELRRLPNHGKVSDGARYDTSYTPEEALSRRQAINAYSLAVAYQLGQENALTEDVVVFDTDLLNCTPEQLQTATVKSVTVAGRKVWPY